MGRRKQHQEHIRKIQRTGLTYYLTLPLRLIRKLGWRKRQKIEVEESGQSLRIKDWKAKK